MAKNKDEWSDPANGSYSDYLEHEAVMFRREQAILGRIRRLGAERPQAEASPPVDGEARGGAADGDRA